MGYTAANVESLSTFRPGGTGQGIGADSETLARSARFVSNCARCPMGSLLALVVLIGLAAIGLLRVLVVLVDLAVDRGWLS